MNRLAVFVEGYTEVVFVEKLVEEIAGKANVRIEQRKIRGGAKAKRKFVVVKAARPDTGQKYYVLIVDCGSDELVKTRILEEHQNLTKTGYAKIIGLRDVRPKFTYADVPRLEASLPKYVKTSLIPVQFILAIMEIEAWFLAETTHFARIDPAITVPAIKATLSFDPENDDLEQRPHPAEDLNCCYAIGGRTYLKRYAQDTIDAIDYAVVYLQLRNRFGYLDRLIRAIEEFLAGP